MVGLALTVARAHHRQNRSLLVVLVAVGWGQGAAWGTACFLRGLCWVEARPGAGPGLVVVLLLLLLAAAQGRRQRGGS